MTLSIFFTSVAFCLTTFFGLYILFLNKKDRLNQVLFLACISLALINIIKIIYLTPFISERTYQILFKIVSVIFITIHYFILIFGILLTRLLPKKKYLFIVLSIPVFITIIQFLIYSDLAAIILKNGLWIITGYYYEGGFYLHWAFLIFYLLAYGVLLLVWRKRTILIREKKQAVILLGTFLITFLICIFDNLIFFQLFRLYEVYDPEFIPYYYLIFISGICYAHIKYRFLNLTPKSVNSDILSNIDESIILMNKDLTIITVNKTTENLINRSNAYQLSDIILEYNDIQTELKNILNKDLNYNTKNDSQKISARLHYKKNNNEKVLMDAIFSVVKDKFGDALGILVIAKEVKEIKQFKHIYKITDREADVIQKIISGQSNSRIAEECDISQNTLKKHITSIYNKLGITNKVELVNLLKEYNLIPEQNAEKTILFVNSQ